MENSNQTSQTQQPENPTPNLINSSKSKVIPIVLGIAAVVVIAIGAYLLGTKQSQPIVQDQRSITPRETISYQHSVFTSHILNFDTLKLSDLLNFVDVRSIYPYNGNQIIIGVDQIAEYNPITKKVVRFLNQDVLKSIHSGALIGNNLFVTSERATNIENDFPPKREMHKIDIRSGEIIKTYFREDPRRLANLKLVEKDGIIWMNSWDGAMRFDPETDEFKNYSDLQLGNLGYHAHGIYIKDGKIKLAFVQFDKVATYDDTTDTWEVEGANSTEWPNAINRRLNDFGLTDIPTYDLTSDKVNDKYYLFSDKGIFTLNRNAMPQFLNDTIIEGSFDTQEGGSKLYITKDEKYALLVGPQICGPGPYDDNLCPHVAGFIINLLTGEKTNLLKNNTEYRTLTDENKLKLANEISLTIVKEDKDQLKLVDVKNKNDVLTIDLITKEASIKK